MAVVICLVILLHSPVAYCDDVKPLIHINELNHHYLTKNHYILPEKENTYYCKIKKLINPWANVLVLAGVGFSSQWLVWGAVLALG